MRRSDPDGQAPVSEANEELVGANTRDVLDLRPMRQLRVSAMRNPARVFRWFLLFIALEALAILAAWAIFSDDAGGAARPATPADCQRIWESAAPGDRFPLKQACLRGIAQRECRTKPRVVPRSVRVKGVRVDAGQRKVISWIVSEGLQRRSHRTIILAAIAATTQEATARELRHGEGTSVGPFQLTSYHGTRAQRITIEHSGNWFFNHAERAYRPGIRPGDLAQAVERSGHPHAYHQWVPEARRTLRAVAGPCSIRS